MSETAIFSRVLDAERRRAAESRVRRAPGIAAHLVVIADHAIDLGHVREHAGLRLRRATGDDDPRAEGRSRLIRRIDCRACATASLVTAQLLMTMVSVRPARSASRAITSDSKALRRQPKVRTSTLIV